VGYRTVTGRLNRIANCWPADSVSWSPYVAGATRVPTRYWTVEIR
jgi:hypothetical protein